MSEEDRLEEILRRLEQQNNNENLSFLTKKLLDYLPTIVLGVIPIIGFLYIVKHDVADHTASINILEAEMKIINTDRAACKQQIDFIISTLNEIKKEHVTMRDK